MADQSPDRRALSLNDGQNIYARAGVIRRLRTATMLLARNSLHIPRCERISVQLHWVPNTRRNRDGDNPTPTVKTCVDGLRDAGVIPDDDTTRVVHLPAVIHDPVRARRGSRYLVVGRLEVTA